MGAWATVGLIVLLVLATFGALEFLQRHRFSRLKAAIDPRIYSIEKLAVAPADDGTIRIVTPPGKQAGRLLVQYYGGAQVAVYRVAYEADGTSEEQFVLVLIQERTIFLHNPRVEIASRGRLHPSLKSHLQDVLRQDGITIWSD